MFCTCNIYILNLLCCSAQCPWAILWPPPNLWLELTTVGQGKLLVRLTVSMTDVNNDYNQSSASLWRYEAFKTTMRHVLTVNWKFEHLHLHLLTIKSFTSAATKQTLCQCTPTLIIIILKCLRSIQEINKSWMPHPRWKDEITIKTTYCNAVYFLVFTGSEVINALQLLSQVK